VLATADQATLDHQLHDLLRLLDRPAQHAAAHAQARSILDTNVGQGLLLPNGDPAGLLRPGWEQYWKTNKQVSWGWFGDIRRDEAAAALHAAVVEMVRFVVGGTSPYLCQKYAGQLAGALRDYLDRRQHQVQPPRPAVAVRLSFDDAAWAVTLDGKRIVVDNPKAYQLYKAIAEATEPLTKPRLRTVLKGKVSGLGGDHTIPRLLKKLPAPLWATLSRTTSGCSARLPPLGEEVES
jgi:hypothetical protein